ncbi:sulfurtransferase complex subunit TusD [Aliikangiella sp. IMCC44359]|uniref:sulfurtransferase complex subunit TusD n=1 Tax=Aliikangiella sp. IMCC44359 TaxID=3459125 RepID=UPI00403ABE47
MSTSFIVLVTGSPNSSQAHLSALSFVKAALIKNHKICSIFFYQEAVSVANRYVCKPSDETNLLYEWEKLSQDNNIELQVCIAAANRRGVLSHEEAAQNQIEGNSLHPAFSILGLGQLAAALCNRENKLIHFK